MVINIENLGLSNPTESIEASLLHERLAKIVTGLAKLGRTENVVVPWSRGTVELVSQVYVLRNMLALGADYSEEKARIVGSIYNGLPIRWNILEVENWEITIPELFQYYPNANGLSNFLGSMLEEGVKIDKEIFSLFLNRLYLEQQLANLIAGSSGYSYGSDYDFFEGIIDFTVGNGSNYRSEITSFVQTVTSHPPHNLIQFYNTVEGIFYVLLNRESLIDTDSLPDLYNEMAMYERVANSYLYAARRQQIVDNRSARPVRYSCFQVILAILGPDYQKRLNKLLTS